MSVDFHEEIRPYLVNIEDVEQHPSNPNNGDIDAIADSIMANGFYGVVIVQKSTGYILAGNHRYAALLKLGATQIPVQLADVDDERALRIVIGDNRTAELAHRDDKALEALLKQLEETDSGLAGTGYDEQSLEELKRLNNITDHAGFEKLTNAIEEDGQNRLTISVYGILSEEGVEPFDNEEVEGVLMLLRDNGYKAMAHMGGF